MTEQYQQNNVNVPRGSRTVDADGNITLDDDIVVCVTATGAITLTLPRAAQIPGQQIVFKADDAGTSGNAVTIVPVTGENIDGAVSVSLTEDQESICLKSDGQNWRQMCAGSGSGACCAPQFTYIGGISMVQFVPQGAAVAVTVAGCNLDNIVSVTPKFDPNGPPAVLPTVNSFSVIAGTPTTMDQLRVELNTIGASAQVVLEVLNDCGCCGVVRIDILPF